MPSYAMINHLARLNRLHDGSQNEARNAELESEHHWVLSHLPQEDELSQVSIRENLRALKLDDGVQHMVRVVVMK